MRESSELLAQPQGILFPRQRRRHADCEQSCATVAELLAAATHPAAPVSAPILPNPETEVSQNHQALQTLHDPCRPTPAPLLHRWRLVVLSWYFPAKPACQWTPLLQRPPLPCQHRFCHSVRRCSPPNHQSIRLHCCRRSEFVAFSHELPRSLAVTPGQPFPFRPPDPGWYHHQPRHRPIPAHRCSSAWRLACNSAAEHRDPGARPNNPPTSCTYPQCCGSRCSPPRT
mmetsp:Transcript_57372/g.136364  ORF Transcript_57372/g.136364 Transcript_57372/m.136364 type:complete len:228 (+) Transcript_57372:567-1250(+)